MSRTAKLLALPIFLLQIGWFVYIAQNRFIDGDEGYFLLASRLVLMHKKPYVDFFFQQAPLLPYVYALWLKLFQITWVWARLLPALLSAILGLLLYQHICRVTGSWLSGVIGSALFAGSTLTFAWFPIAKPYSLAGLFIFAAYVLVSCFPERHLLWRLASAGFLLALAIGTRSYLLLAIPLFLWWIYRNAGGIPAKLPLVPFLTGLVFGLLPCFYFFASSPRRFLFDNLGYHAVRTDYGLLGLWSQKAGVLLMLLLGGPEGNGIQIALLFIISVAFIFSIDEAQRAPRLAFQLALLIGVISLLPTPVLPQYFSFCIPFLIVSAVCVAHNLTGVVVNHKWKSLATTGWLFLTCIYITVSVPDLRKYLVTGDGIPAVRGAYDREDWKLNRILEVSQTIDMLIHPGEVVASFWPGYLFQTKAAPFPGLETDCGLPIADRLSAEQLKLYHVLSWSQVDLSFASHYPRVVVVPNHQSYLGGYKVGDRASAVLSTNRYERRSDIGDTSIYTCCFRK